LAGQNAVVRSNLTGGLLVACECDNQAMRGQGSFINDNRLARRIIAA